MAMACHDDACYDTIQSVCNDWVPQLFQKAADQPPTIGDATTDGNIKDDATATMAPNPNFVRRRSSNGSSTSLPSKNRAASIPPNNSNNTSREGALPESTSTAAIKSKKKSKMKRIFKSAKKTASSAIKPAASNASMATTNGASSSAASSTKYPCGEGIIKMDKYGFLIEDEQCLSNSSDVSGGSDGPGSVLDVKRWETILDKGQTKNNQSNTPLTSSTAANSFLTSQSKLKYYARRGLPDSLRQKAWTVLTGVDLMMTAKDNTGRYNALVEEAEVEFDKMQALEKAMKTSEISRVGNLLETIERDISRTFPKHYMFHNGFDDDDDSPCNGNGNNGSSENGAQLGDNDEQGEAMYDPENNVASDDEDDEANNNDDVVEIADASKFEDKRRMIRKSVQLSLRQMSSSLGEEEGELLESFGGNNNSSSTTSGANKDDNNVSTSQHSTEQALGLGHGQDALRNVLRAYSLYDTEVGYCQGMNFIAAMFLTFLSEEESFWLLVVVMNREPYKIRDLFGEDMAGTHEVLYIAEKLLEQFLPELYQHFEKENIHVTMFVTQWLVTLYVREFPFDLVARVWDSFLVEGWKVIYRVLLSLMECASKDILGFQFEQILHYLRDFPSTVNGQDIMTASLKINLKRKHIQKHATVWRQNLRGGG